MSRNDGVNHAILWTIASGDLKCMVLRYDETRYQLRLARGTGTVKSELFAELEAAVAVSKQWRRAVDADTR